MYSIYPLGTHRTVPGATYRVPTRTAGTYFVHSAVRISSSKTDSYAYCDQPTVRYACLQYNLDHYSYIHASSNR